jgi:hypothetical protein
MRICSDFCACLTNPSPRHQKGLLPLKRRRALLASNPPRDSWSEAHRIDVGPATLSPRLLRAAKASPWLKERTGQAGRKTSRGGTPSPLRAPHAFPSDGWRHVPSPELADRDCVGAWPLITLSRYQQRKAVSTMPAYGARLKINFLIVGREPQAITRTLAMMAYNPAIGRVVESGGLDRFSHLMDETIHKLWRWVAWAASVRRTLGQLCATVARSAGPSSSVATSAPQMSH